MEENKQSKKEQLIEKWKDKKKILIFALLLLALISTVLVSFIIQNNTKQPVIDTVVVNPFEERNIVLSGQIRYSDKTAFTNGNVELHSKVMKTTTDEKGWFLFEEVTPEEHKLSAFDKDGNELASALINLKQLDSKTELNISKDKDNKYHIEISVDTRYLELSIELKDNLLIINPNNTYSVNDEGKVYNHKGILDSEDGYIRLPSGTVITDENNIIHFPNVLTSDNTVIEIPEDGIILDDGTKIDGEGNITLPDGTIIDKDGTITDSDNNEYIPDEDIPVIITPDGDIEPIKPTPPNNNDDNNNDDVPVTPDQPEENKGSFNVIGQVGNSIGEWTNPWKVDTSIDLFHNQSGGVSKYKNGVPVIQPGSSGYYLFQIENKRKAQLELEIYIQETTYHLPLKYRLAPISNYDESLSDDLKWTNSVSLENKTIIRSEQVATGKTVLYRLEWEWPYESNHDDIDTEQGKKAEVYKVNIGVGIQ